MDGLQIFEYSVACREPAKFGWSRLKIDPWISTLPKMTEHLTAKHPEWSIQKMERFVQSSANNFIEQKSYGCARKTAYRTRQSSLDGVPALARTQALAGWNGMRVPDAPVTNCSPGSNVQARSLTTFASNAPVR
jgi:hypothetical protein